MKVRCGGFSLRWFCCLFHFLSAVIIALFNFVSVLDQPADLGARLVLAQQPLGRPTSSVIPVGPLRWLLDELGTGKAAKMSLRESTDILEQHAALDRVSQPSQWFGEGRPKLAPGRPSSQEPKNETTELQLTAGLPSYQPPKTGAGKLASTEDSARLPVAATGANFFSPFSQLKPLAKWGGPGASASQPATPWPNSFGHHPGHAPPGHSQAVTNVSVGKPDWGEQRCPRCQKRDSFIYLWGQDQAGLLDRMTILEVLGGLAKFLCATLLLPPPCALLHSMHNQGKLLDCSGPTWSRYFSTSDRGMEPWMKRNMAADRHFFESGMLVIPRGMDFWDQARQALKAAQQGRRFLWHFDRYFWSFAKAPDRIVFTKGILDCKALVTISWSPLVRRLAGDFVRRWLPKSFNTLHVRRNDVVGKDCDTSIPRVVRYVNCSLRGDTRPLVVFTDANSGYRKRLLGGLTDFMPHVLHGDPLLASVSAEGLGVDTVDDNFLVFAVGRRVQEMAVRNLEQRRMFRCSDCDVPPLALSKEGGNQRREGANSTAGTRT